MQLLAADVEDVVLVVDVDTDVDAGADVVPAWPGIQPPFTQVPPPIETNGSGIVQPVLTDGVGTGALVDGADEGVDALVMPPGIQPPFTQVPPPIETNGSGVVQPVAVVGTAAVVVGVDAALDALVIPPGIQPPFTHVPPPIETNGSGVMQLLAGIVEAGLPVVGDESSPRPDDVLVDTPGIQPPLTQVPPPIERNGSGVVQAAPAIELEATVGVVGSDARAALDAAAAGRVVSVETLT